MIATASHKEQQVFTQLSGLAALLYTIYLRFQGGELNIKFFALLLFVFFADIFLAS